MLLVPYESWQVLGDIEYSVGREEVMSQSEPLKTSQKQGT